MKRVNIYGAQPTYDDTDPDGYRSGVVRISRELEAKANSVNLLEIPPNQSICPYHYEYEEEWLIVLEGTVILRAPDGEHELHPGDTVVFPPGPEGAHKVTNRSDQTAKTIMFSSAHEPAVAVYPDSDKIGVWPGNADDKVMLRRADGHVDYYDGET
jgi:uncharacterized cupin superfamily protein